MAGVSEGLMLFITPTFYASFDPLRKISDNSDVLQAALSTVDEQYHEAVIRELEAMS
jgi:hypothetical protein